ncbi:MAG: Fic family protein [Thermodesulfobacteriota bacterium]|nr:Fic family protein [Thermodesulfobacteriota bacterium]
MRRGSTGQYETTSVAGETIRAFIPNSLPPDPALTLSDQRQRLLERATVALGRLDSVTLLLPDPNMFLYAYVRREAVLSSQIEGTQSSLAQLLLFEMEEAPGVPIDDVREVSNYVAALNHGLKRLQEDFPLSNRLIREMHEILLSQGRGGNKSPSEFRRSQNWIGGTRPGNAYFVPPPPGHVQACMTQLEGFLHDAGNAYPTLIKAALAHVQFETIHPFLDGNGRIGRLLIAFVLHHDRLLSQPLLYLSLYFKQHRPEYYRLLDLVRTEGDWEAWLDFFLEGVEQIASNAVETAKRLLSLFQQDEQKIQTLGRSASTTIRVFRVLCEHPLASLSRICKLSGLSFPAAAKGMQHLETLDIVSEITGQQRNRVFVYQQYLSILNEGTEKP